MNIGAMKLSSRPMPTQTAKPIARWVRSSVVASSNCAAGRNTRARVSHNGASGRASARRSYTHLLQQALLLLRLLILQPQAGLQAVQPGRHGGWRS